MSTETDPFEKDLAAIPRVELPAAFREETLNKACVAEGGSIFGVWWNSTPKPIAVAVAAAWVAIAALKFTTPSSVEHAARPIVAAEAESEEKPLLAWAERHRNILQNL